MALKVGDEAPDFEAEASDGRRIRLSEYRGKKNVVLYFYPKDFTRVCTAEACGFRDLTKDGALGDGSVEVIGVSGDTVDSHQRFVERHGLNFPLVSDRDRAIGRKYETSGFLVDTLKISKRVTYVIDRAGKIAAVMDGFFSADGHIDGARAALQKLK
jgi:peroxiredoxin Q/BCP